MSPNPSPNPLITPAPTPPLHLLLPRQSDAFDLSSLYAELSSMEADYSSFDYSSFLAAYSTSEFDYSSFYAEYSSAYLDYSSLLDSLTATSAGQLGNTLTTRTTRPTSTSLESTNGGSSSGLSMGAKIGIGVAVPLIVLLLAGLGIFLWCAGKRKGRKKTNTIVAPMGQTPAQPPPQQPYQPQPQLYPQNQGYQPGYQQSPQQYAVSPIQQVPPPQYVQPQAADPNAAFAGYGKGPAPAHGAVELETEYHFARGGAVEIGDTEAAVEEKKGWRAKLGRKPVPNSS